MAINCKTSKAEISKMFEDNKDIVRKQFIRTLSFVGEKAVEMIRKQPQNESWNDQTGNLRSSIGYVVIAEGQIVTISDFEKVKDGNIGTQKGQSYARTIANNLINNISSNYALIVVAGMEYAIYVERMQNKVVLAKAKIQYEKELPKYIEKTTERIVKEIQDKINAHK